MHLYTDEFMEKLEIIYKDKPKNAFFNIATLSHNSGIKFQTEEWLNELSVANRNQFLKRFKKNHDNFLDTYHELAIGILFKRAELNPEYDKEINGKTPDWFLPANGHSACIVEVSSLNMPQGELEIAREISKIRNAISTLPFKASLSARFKNHDIESIKVIDLEATLILLKEWLALKPDAGSKLKTDNLKFELMWWSENFTHTQLLGPAQTFFSDTRRLDSKVKDKILSYLEIASLNKLPLIVVIVVDWSTAIDEIDFEKLLYGTGVEVVSLPEYAHVEGFEVNKSYSELSGLFYQYPEYLSAVVFTTGRQNNWNFKYYVNPRKENLLSEEFFKKLPKSL
jgi:hypothetical protein